MNAGRGEPGAHRLGGPQGFVTGAGAALELTWRAGPVACVCHLLLTVVQGLLPAALTLLTKWLFDALQYGRDAAGPSPLALATGLGAVTALMALLPLAADYTRARLQRGIAHLAQQRLYGKVNRFIGLSRFEDPQFLDRLRLAQDSAISAPAEITTAMSGLVQQAIAVLGMVAVLSSISPWLTVVTVAAAVPALLVQVSLTRRQAALMWRISPRNRRQIFYQGLMLDVSAVKEVRLFGAGGFLLGRMNSETRDINAAEERHERRVFAFQSPPLVLSALIAAGGLAWTVHGALSGRFGVGDVSAFLTASAGVQGALSAMISHITGGYQGLLTFRHYVDVNRLPVDLPVRPDPVPVAPLADRIEFDDVWFRYRDDGPWVLRGVSLTINRGESVALVGLNGAGKSTLVKLICRLYDPTRGTVRWDGTDIREMDPSQLRDRISAVFQDRVAYDLSATDNIGIGDLRHLGDPERIADAARRADAHDFIGELPRGYATLLSRTFPEADDEGTGEPSMGVALSGGQWQRLALARAMLREDRDLIILDEPTAGLDAAAEHGLHERMRAHRAGATSLLISHRLGTVRGADRIVVLADGRISECGSHGELVALHGEYARLFALQASGYTDDENEAEDEAEDEEVAV
ncbi:ABC transporter ATP-binding protein [Streptomyces sp. NPDC005953]|uniref:ABC transporter ATP-binding protein n=1 Tax=Streptomyces sp. NPDC005953 TaxID=3156719 RepID=UPI0033F9BCD8